MLHRSVGLSEQNVPAQLLWPSELLELLLVLLFEHSLFVSSFYEITYKLQDKVFLFSSFAVSNVLKDSTLLILVNRPADKAGQSAGLWWEDIRNTFRNSDGGCSICLPPSCWSHLSQSSDCSWKPIHQVWPLIRLNALYETLIDINVHNIVRL